MIRRTPTTEDARPRPVHPEGRRCPRCDTALSKYNPGPECYRHKPFKKPRVRGRV